MSRVGGNTYKRKTEKALLKDRRDLQAIKLLPLQFAGDPFHCLEPRFLPFVAEDDSVNLSGKIKEVPVGLVDCPAKFVAIEISDGFPAGEYRFSVYGQVVRQDCVVSDKDGFEFADVFHLHFLEPSDFVRSWTAELLRLARVNPSAVDEIA